MELFRTEDKKVIPPTNEDEYLVCKYSCPVSVAIDRLMAMGFKTEDVEIGQKTYIDQLMERYLELNETPDPTVVKRITDFSYNVWKDTIRLMFAGHHLEKNHFDQNYGLEDNFDIVSNIYMDQSFFGVDAPCLSSILAILELVADKHNTEVALDYSELVSGGYVEEEDELCKKSDFEKTVILTEGVSDRRFIERSLRVLYPHLTDYFSFLDFQELKLAGSASSLVHTIKAFSAAGIRSRMVAVFDNDTAAKDAMKPLSCLPIAKNIRIVTLPCLEFLNNYPTIGPQGLHNINVNGLAGSIELYFEETSLRDESQNLIPVVWKGFIEAEQKYQGEISKKVIVQSQFEEILNRVEAGDSVSNYNFDSMKKVLETIFGFKPVH